MALLQNVKSGPFMYAFSLSEVIIGFFVALFNFLFLLIAFAFPLLVLGALTVIFLWIQYNYAPIIQDIVNSPNGEQILTTLLNTVVAGLNFLIALARVLIEVIDFFVPLLYEVMPFLINFIKDFIEQVFGSPSLQCVLAELFAFAMECFEVSMIGIQKIMAGFERGLQTQVVTTSSLNARDIPDVSENAYRMYRAPFTADRTGADPTILLRTQTFEAMGKDCDGTTVNDPPPSDPGTDGTCPSNSVLMDRLLPVVKKLIEMASTILAFMADSLVIFLKLVVIDFINLLPSLVQSIMQILNALSSNGVFNDVIQIMRQIIMLATPTWDATCPIFSLLAWGLCALSGWLSNFLNSQFATDIKDVWDSIDCVWDSLESAFKRRDSSYLAWLQNPAFGGEDGHMHLVHEYHSRTTSRDLSMAEDGHIRVATNMRAQQSNLFRPSNSRLKRSIFADSVRGQAQSPRHARSLHVRSPVVGDVIDTAYNIMSQSTELNLLVERFFWNTQNRNFRETTYHAFWHWADPHLMTAHPSAGIFAETNAKGDTSSSCSPSDAAEGTWGPSSDTQDGDLVAQGTGGAYDQLGEPSAQVAPSSGGCQQFLYICPCPSGQGGQPGSESTWDGVKSLISCEAKAIKTLLKDIMPLVDDIIQLLFDILGALPQILKAVTIFMVQLTIDIADFIGDFIANASPLMTAMFNMLADAGGLTDAINDLNYTSLEQSNPQMLMQGTVDQSNSGQGCPSGLNLTQRALNPACPEFHCLQITRKPELCFFPDQDYPGRSASVAASPSCDPYNVTYEALTREEFLALSRYERKRVGDRYNVRTLRRRPGIHEFKIMGRHELGALRATFFHKKPEHFGVDSWQWQEMLDHYDNFLNYSRRLNEQGQYAAQKLLPYVGTHLYSYEPAHPSNTGKEPEQPEAVFPDTGTCIANASSPYACCDAESTASECCDRLFFCLPAIPASFRIPRFTDLDWLGNITTTTCKPFSNGCKEVLFLIRFAFSATIIKFINNAPLETMRATYQLLLGWATFPQGQFPPFGFICFFLNLGGLFLLMFILLVLALVVMAFYPYITQLYDVYENIMMQREISEENSNDQMLQNMMFAGPVSSSVKRRMILRPYSHALRATRAHILKRQA